MIPTAWQWACRSSIFRSKPGRIYATLLALGLAHASALAQSDFEEDFDDPYKPWQEVALQLPAPPKEQDLLPFKVSETATHRFAIDAGSLAVGKDGVVRFTLVTSSSAGARNVRYEGIRCSTREQKSYAFGQSDGSWSPARRDRWEKIDGNRTNRHHAVLAREYLCEEGSVSGSAEQIVHRLRRGISLDPSLGP